MVKKTEMNGLYGFIDKRIGGMMANKIKKTMKVLDNFDQTNNGVIYTQNKKYKGGANNDANKNPLNTCAILGYSENPIDICSNRLIVFDFNNLKDYILAGITKEDEKVLFRLAQKLGYGNTSNIKIDDILLNFYINNRKLPDADNNFSGIKDQILGTYLERYIIQNKDYRETVTNTLRYDDHGKYKISDLEKAGKDNKTTSYTIGDETVDYYHEGENEWVQDFSHNGYNKDIVQAYEKNFIDNFKNLPNFISKQYDHIATMSLTDKIVINDYTKKSCFHFYLAYASKLISKQGLGEIMKKDGSWITGYKIDQWYDDPHNESPELYGFGDSFFKQIFAVIKEEKFNKIIKSKLEHSEYVTNIDQYWNFLKDKGIERAHPNSLSIFKDELTDEEWDEVMRKFINDIDTIIAQAPETDNIIYCYRAVSNDYISLRTGDDHINTDGPKIYRNDEGTYINTRIGSLSLNYDSSVRYLKKGTMYRAYIMDGVRVLYIPSLSYASDEFEILHGSYGIFVDKKENYKCYNNKKNKYGILSYKDDQFNSARVGLAGYSRYIHRDKFERIQNALSDTLENIRTTTKSSIKKIYQKNKESLTKSKTTIDSIITNVKGLENVELISDNTDNTNNNDLDDDTLDDDIKALEKYIEKLEADTKKGGAAKKRLLKK